MQIISNKAAQFTSTKWPALKVIHSLGQLLQVTGLHTVTKQKAEAVMTLLTILFTFSAVKYILLAFFSVWKQFVACDKDAYLSWTTVKVRFPRYYLIACCMLSQVILTKSKVVISVCVFHQQED